MEAALKNEGFQVSPAPHQLPSGSCSPGSSSPAKQTPTMGAGKLALQNQGGLGSGEGDALPSDPCSPSKTQSWAGHPIWDTHHVTWLLPVSSILPL